MATQQQTRRPRWAEVTARENFLHRPVLHTDANGQMWIADQPVAPEVQAYIEHLWDRNAQRTAQIEALRDRIEQLKAGAR